MPQDDVHHGAALEVSLGGGPASWQHRKNNGLSSPELPTPSELLCLHPTSIRSSPSHRHGRDRDVLGLGRDNRRDRVADLGRDTEIVESGPRAAHDVQRLVVMPGRRCERASATAVLLRATADGAQERDWVFSKLVGVGAGKQGPRDGSPRTPT